MFYISTYIITVYVKGELCSVASPLSEPVRRTRPTVFVQYTNGTGLVREALHMTRDEIPTCNIFLPSARRSTSAKSQAGQFMKIMKKS